MDIATLVGVLLSIILIVGSIFLGGAPLTIFIDIPSALVVLGGSMGAVLICFPLRTVLGAPRVLMKVFLNRTEDLNRLIAQIVSLAETARRDGLLALEGRLEQLDNAFIRLGVQMAVDGTRPEIIQDIMRTEIDAI